MALSWSQTGKGDATCPGLVAQQPTAPSGVTRQPKCHGPRPRSDAAGPAKSPSPPLSPQYTHMHNTCAHAPTHPHPNAAADHDQAIKTCKPSVCCCTGQRRSCLLQTVKSGHRQGEKYCPGYNVEQESEERSGMGWETERQGRAAAALQNNSSTRRGSRKERRHSAMSRARGWKETITIEVS